jgi:Leucine-rich repeat (LRR) protein
VALKEFYSTGISAWTFDFANIGSSGSTMTIEEFISDVDNLKDPCGGAGNVTERLDGIHCIGGHVVFIGLRGFGGAHVRFLPPSMGALAHLKVFEHVNLGGAVGNWPTIIFPPEIGSWSQLESFVYCGGNILDQKLSLPASMGTWRNMKYLDIADIGLQGQFPTGVFASPSIVAVRLDAVPLLSIPPVGGMSNLAVFSLKNNGIKGPMPSFEGLVKLSTISFEGNKVTGGTVKSFDGCSSLKELDLTGNALDCELFNFSGCTELTKIDIAKNKLRGAIPVSWGLLKKVKIIRASNNEIGGPNRSYLKPLSSMTAVVELHLSRNIIGWERPGCSNEAGDRCNQGPEWMAEWMNANMRVVDLSRNRLRSPPCLHEISCDLSSQIQGIGPISNIYPNLVSVDLSHNELKEVFSLKGITANWVSLALRYHTTQ